LVGFIGSLAWWQGVENLVQAAAILKKKGLKIKLIIIGDGELRSFVEQLCKKLDVNYEITGFLPHEEALRLLKELDVMALPSRRISTTESNIPIKVIEAWGLGVPVVVTRHKGLVILGIRDREDVVYCEPDPYDVARALLEVLTSEKLCERLRKNGLKIAHKYDYGTIADRVIKSVLSKD